MKLCSPMPNQLVSCVNERCDLTCPHRNALIVQRLENLELYRGKHGVLIQCVNLFSEFIAERDDAARPGLTFWTPPSIELNHLPLFHTEACSAVATADCLIL